MPPRKASPKTAAQPKTAAPEVEGLITTAGKAPRRPFTDPLDASKTWDTVTQELAYWARNNLGTIVAGWLDMLRDRVALGDDPDQILNITGTGAAVAIPHNLTDGNGKSVAPRAYRPLGWSKTDTFNVSAMDSATITVKIAAGGSMQLALYI